MNVNFNTLTFGVRIAEGYDKIRDVFIYANERKFRQNISPYEFCNELNKVLPDENDLVKFKEVDHHPENLNCFFGGEITTKGQVFPFKIFASYIKGTKIMSNNIIKNIKEIIGYQG